VPESAEPPNDFSLEASMPEGTAPLETIVCTEELQRRPWRPPNFEMENRALVALVTALSDSASTIFQTLAETILDVTKCDSSGLSLLTPDGGKRFYWPAIAGMWAPHVGGGTPRNFAPCGDVLDRNCTMLFRHFERRYPYLMPVIPAAEECLLVPFYVDGRAVGTIWGIMHSDRRQFDSEDGRIMGALGQFASVAYRTMASIDNLKVQIAARVGPGSSSIGRKRPSGRAPTPSAAVGPNETEGDFLGVCPESRPVSEVRRPTKAAGPLTSDFADQDSLKREIAETNRVRSGSMNWRAPVSRRRSRTSCLTANSREVIGDALTVATKIGENTPGRLERTQNAPALMSFAWNRPRLPGIY
jgi:hypothetical protein